MHAGGTIDRNQAILLIIDVQSRLLPHIDRHAELVACSAALIEAAGVFGVPVMATVQYVKGLGETVEPLAGLLRERDAALCEKIAFSVCRDEACRARISRSARRQVIIAGIEAHVCVQQTVLDLLAMNVTPVVCADAVSSRRALDRETALSRMGAAGAIVTTTEAVMFELCTVSGTPEFKQLHGIVKRLDETRAEAMRGSAGGAR